MPTSDPDHPWVVSHHIGGDNRLRSSVAVSAARGTDISAAGGFLGRNFFIFSVAIGQGMSFLSDFGWRERGQAFAGVHNIVQLCCSSLIIKIDVETLRSRCNSANREFIIEFAGATKGNKNRYIT